MQEQHTTPEQMLDLLGEHIKAMLAANDTGTNTDAVAPLLEIYFKYTIGGREIIPRAQRKKS